jgi:hypothetical protein
MELLEKPMNFFCIQFCSTIIKKKKISTQDYNNLLFYFLVLKYHFKNQVILLKIKKGSKRYSKFYSVIKSPFVHNKSHIKLVKSNYKSLANSTFIINNFEYINSLPLTNNLLIFKEYLENTNNLFYKFKVSYFSTVAKLIK